MLVEQEFHEDWRACLAEENPLHVGSHREHLVALPLVGQRREVGSAVVHIVKPHQAHQWKHHALVAETEGCAVFAIQNRLVGSGDEVAQKVGLHVWHTVFGEWSGTSPEIPADIVILPNFQTVFLAEKVVEVHILKLVMALHVAHHIKEVEHKLLWLFHIRQRPLAIGEQGAEQSLWLEIFILQRLFLSLIRSAAQAFCHRVVVVHEVHIVLRCIGGDAELWIEALEGGHSVLHRENATNHNCGTRIYGSIAGKHFRIVLIHASGNALVLLCTDVAQFAQTLVRRSVHLFEGSQSGLTTSREFAHRVGFREDGNGGTVLLWVDEPTAAVTAIMVDIEWRISLWRSGKRWQILVGIGIIIVGCLLVISLKVFTCASIDHHRQCESKN